MKLADLKKGTKILVPCARCGAKRSLIYRSVAEYRVQKGRICFACASEDRSAEPGSAMHEKNPNHRRGAVLDRWRLENS